jgi:hypothetical protein
VYRKGDVFTFGRYPQGARGEVKPIQWIVLNRRDDGNLLLISKYALDTKPYNAEDVDVTWETCTLRKWLNGVFYNAAFSAQEQANIVPVTLKNEDNPEDGTKGGQATQDRVWLLSLREAERYFKDDNSRMCAPTEYAVAQGTFQNSNSTVDGVGACWWWLRSPGYNSDCAAFVNIDGFVIYYGGSVDYDSSGVRPVVVALP